MPHNTVTVTRDSRRDTPVTTGVTFAVSHGTPSRPVPTLPVLSPYVSASLTSACGQKLQSPNPKSLGKYRARIGNVSDSGRFA